MMAFGGVANAAAQYAWTKALLLAPTSAVSPFYYLMLVWAMVIGFVVWGDVPTTALIIGSAIVIASGHVPAMARGATALMRQRAVVCYGEGERPRSARGSRRDRGLAA